MHATWTVHNRKEELLVKSCFLLQTLKLPSLQIHPSCLAPRSVYVLLFLSLSSLFFSLSLSDWLVILFLPGCSYRARKDMIVLTLRKVREHSEGAEFLLSATGAR